MADSKKKHNDLSLKPGIPSRKLANLFSCVKSQIQGILKNKQHYEDLYGEKCK